MNTMPKLSCNNPVSNIPGTKMRKHVKKTINNIISQLKRRSLHSSFELTQELLILLRLIVTSKRWQSPDELIIAVRSVGRRLIRARPTILVIGNVFRRVIHTIREEHLNMLKKQQEMQLENGNIDEITQSDKGVQSFDLDDGGQPLLETGNSDFIATMTNFAPPEGWSLSAEVASSISEMSNELDNINEPICKQAAEHIHAEDVVLVHGMSRTVLHFLSTASRKRIFKVIVAEAGPECSGHHMAKALANQGIPTTLIPDGNIFALLPIVNKIILGTHAIMANGGLICSPGSHQIAQAAKHHSVPVICVTGLYKLCPLFPYNRDSLIELKSPGLVSSYAELGGFDNLHVVLASTDYVPPELLTLLVTDTGGHQSSYVYRLLAESYDISAEEEL